MAAKMILRNTGLRAIAPTTSSRRFVAVRASVEEPAPQTPSTSEQVVEKLSVEAPVTSVPVAAAVTTGNTSMSFTGKSTG